MRILYSILLAAAIFAAPLPARADRNVYLDLMEEAVNAYTPERLRNYIDRVDAEGIKEHGYARITSNIGILLAHGRIQDKKTLFEEMMDICVRETPVARRKNEGQGHFRCGNDFAVKEIVACITEIEKSGIFPKEKTDAWREGLKYMKAEDIYSEQPEPGGIAKNWCIFGSASECVRLSAGIGGDRAFADKYMTDQLRFFDENGMYMDPGCPMVYDFVTRLQFMVALNAGYDGPAKEALEGFLLKSALPTLQMISVTGEMPYGGRSNQFLHNETVMCAVCEYYASWFARRGDMELASRFKSAASECAASLWYWLNQKPVRHLKNRYPTETGYGCEGYAYFDKYMVTMASWAYLAFAFANDDIPMATAPEPDCTFVTSDNFHRIMMRAGGYTVQIDTDAQKLYDCNGIGRFQKKGASPVIALASPCAADLTPNYKLDITSDGGLAIAPEWDKYEIIKAETGLVVLSNGESTWIIKLSKKGLKMVLKGKGEQMLTLPAFEFDGESNSEIKVDGRNLSIAFGGAVCQYRSNGTITDSGKVYANRNGHLRRMEARRTSRLVVRASIK